jgi:hypothetical protein
MSSGAALAAYLASGIVVSDIELLCFGAARIVGRVDIR